MKDTSILTKYGYLWATLVLFLGSIAGHWMLGWEVYVQEQEEQNQPITVRDYVFEMSRDTLENWQSEFLQLLWQVGGLAFLFYVGSPQSKEGDDRKEEKLDYILAAMYPKDAEKILTDLEEKYPKR